MPASDDEATLLFLKHRASLAAGIAPTKPSKPVRLPRKKSLKAADPKVYNPEHDGVAKANKAYKICVHCKKNIVNRPKGLCWGCYYTPGVRDLYPSTSKYARRGVGNFSGSAPLPQVPTTAAPGTEAKVKVMGERAKLQQQLFHPADARYENDPVTLEWLENWAKQTLTGVAA